MGRALKVLFLASVLAGGCTWVEKSDENFVTIGTGDFGALAPGLRQVVSYPEARAHCAKFDKVAELYDLKGKNAVWQCVPRE
jgi:hypothetical protein